jgi:hypothetical protein
MRVTSARPIALPNRTLKNVKGLRAKPIASIAPRIPPITTPAAKMSQRARPNDQ